MNKLRYYHKKNKFTYIKATLLTLFFCLLFSAGYVPYEETGDNFFHIFVNGQEVGVLKSADNVESMLIEARRSIAAESGDLVFLETNYEVVGEEKLWGTSDSEETVFAAMKRVLRGDVIETMHRSYTVKVDQFLVNLASLEDARTLLQAALDKYDAEDKFTVGLEYDNRREFNVLKSTITREADGVKEQIGDYSTSGGVASILYDSWENEFERSDTEKEFSDYELGITNMDFAESVEVVEVYLPESQLVPLEEAINRVTKDQEVPSIYVVQKGDTLSEIAIKVNIPMDQIIAMNDSLESEKTILQIGQELIITVPEPELSVKRTETKYVEEIYDANVIYVDVPEWYTSQTQVVQQPSAGFRKIIARVTYENDRMISREIVKEEVVLEAVAKIVKRGTKVPPTYIKPLNGGRVSSSFGYRNAPTKGASTYHKGVDWATPTGTPVLASSAGTVVKAGWGSGYGYVVYINHADGKQTRYAHCSKLLVSVGQKVKQGEKIALSGNTGVSTGPHVHFEILVNGVQVNPLGYVPR